MVLFFMVKGEPEGKGRPRFNPYGKGKKPVTPEQTLLYENLIGWEFRSQCNKSFSEKEPIKMKITAYYSIPSSKSKKEKKLMEENIIRPTKKPDIDNVAKVYADALNHLAYHDDSQIVSLLCEKYYSYNPRVEVIISSLDEDI